MTKVFVVTSGAPNAPEAVFANENTAIQYVAKKEKEPGGITYNWRSTGYEVNEEIVAAGPPVETTAPHVDGDAAVGGTLSSTMGTWDNMEEGTHSYAYQWRREGQPIDGAAAETYTCVAEDEGKLLSCEVTATNAIGSASSMSNEIGPVGPEAPPLDARHERESRRGGRK